ncbi:MAG: hypothetical protein ACTS73_07550 [Arsenophonus sp. NEOnobi-MAG3]
MLRLKCLRSGIILSRTEICFNSSLLPPYSEECKKWRKLSYPLSVTFTRHIHK